MCENICILQFFGTISFDTCDYNYSTKKFRRQHRRPLKTSFIAETSPLLTQIQKHFRNPKIRKQSGVLSAYKNGKKLRRLYKNARVLCFCGLCRRDLSNDVHMSSSQHDTVQQHVRESLSNLQRPGGDPYRKMNYYNLFQCIFGVFQ